jgi:hypothetical protein
MVYVVTHPDFANSYSNLVSSGVGVLSLSKRGVLTTVKLAERGHAGLDNQTMFRCLRRQEYLAALKAVGYQSINLPNGIVNRHCSELFSRLDTFEAHSLFVSALRKRKTDSQTVSFVSALPHCLRVLGYGTPMSDLQRRGLIAALQQDISFTIA